MAERPERKRWLLWFPTFTLLVVLIASVVTVFHAYLLPQHAAGIVHAAFPKVPGTLIFSVCVMIILGTVIKWHGLWSSQSGLYLLTGGGFALMFLMVEPIVGTVSHLRSSKELAEKSAFLIPTEAQVVIYDAYFAGLPFYLKIAHPMIVVSSGAKHRIMASTYVARKMPAPAVGHQQALLNYDGFRALWKQPHHQLFIFLHAKDLHRFVNDKATCSDKLLQVRDVVLLRQVDCS